MSLGIFTLDSLPCSALSGPGRSDGKKNWSNNTITCFIERKCVQRISGCPKIPKFLIFWTKTATHIQHGFDSTWIWFPVAFVLITRYPDHVFVCAGLKRDPNKQDREKWLAFVSRLSAWPTSQRKYKHDVSRWKLQHWDRMSKYKKHKIWPPCKNHSEHQHITFSA